MNVYDLSAEFQGGFTTKRRRTDVILLHHAAALYPQGTGEADVRAIAKFHTDPEPRGRGWDGVGYHEILAEETQGGPIAAYIVSDPLLQRAHIAHQNDTMFGICAATNFNKHPNKLPEQKWINALAERVRFRRQQLNPKAEIAGHREKALPGFTTSCPGDKWHDWKPDLLALVEGRAAGFPKRYEVIADETWTRTGPGTRYHRAWATLAAGYPLDIHEIKEGGWYEWRGQRSNLWGWWPPAGFVGMLQLQPV